MGERQGGHPAVATLGIGALAVEIRDVIAQSVGLGNAASLATHFAINPHCPLYYSNQQPVLPQQTLIPTIRPITPPSSDPITIAGPAMAQYRRSRPKRSMTSSSCLPSSARIGISFTTTRAACISSAPSSRSSNSPIWSAPTCWASVSPTGPTRR